MCTSCWSSSCMCITTCGSENVKNVFHHARLELVANFDTIYSHTYFELWNCRLASFDGLCVSVLSHIFFLNITTFYYTIQSTQLCKLIA